jgi:signal peptidase II
MIVALGALVDIGAYAVKLGAHERLARTGLALILGGAIGNLLDRIMHGYVLDFVDVYYRDVHFWAFNVADAAITAGAALVLFEVIFSGHHHASAAV